MKQTTTTRAIASSVPEDLYDWLKEEQARLAQKSIRLPMASVVRMILQQAKDQQQAQEPKRKAR